MRPPRLPPCTEGSRAPTNGHRGCTAVRVGGRVRRRRGGYPTDACHAAASRRSLVLRWRFLGIACDAGGRETARGAACGRTRAQADRCPHKGVPDWPTAVRNVLTRSGHPACRVPRSDELIGTSGASHTSHEQPRRPDAGVGVHRDDRRNSWLPRATGRLPRPPVCTPPRTSTTPAVSPSWRTCAGRRSHDIVEQGLTALRNLEHRGARGAEPDTGDGAGILIQVPDAFLREVVDFDLPPRRRRTPSASPSCPGRGGGRDRGRARSRRSPPRRTCGPRLARRPDRRRQGRPGRRPPAAAMPLFRQLFVASARRRGRRSSAGWRWSGCAFCLRKRAEHETDVYFPSLSPRTLVYKGMLTTDQLEPFFPDLADQRVASALAARALAVLDQHVPALAAGPPVPAHRPQRRDQHRAWATATGCGPARRCSPRDLIPGDLERLFPICTPGARDSASFDEVLELLHLGGRIAAARGADDDPGGVGEPRRDGPGPPRLLRVPLRR